MKRTARSAALILSVSWFAATAARSQVLETVDRYASGDVRITVECFAPDAAGTFPAVFLLHGAGGLDPGTLEAFREIGRGLASQGYVAFVPSYFEKTGHKPGTRFGDDEVKSYQEALKHGIAFAGNSKAVDPDRIGLVGYSMGAVLAFLHSARDPKIKAIVSCSGPLLVEMKAKFPPVLILQGSKDKGNRPERLKAFEEKLKADETPYATHIYRGLGHNFDMSAWDDAGRRMLAFFNRHMKGLQPRKSTARRKRPGRSQNETAADPGLPPKPPVLD